VDFKPVTHLLEDQAAAVIFECPRKPLLAQF
jgi:hypothetical protein